MMRGSILVVICPYTISGSFSQNCLETNISFVTSIRISVFVRVSVCVKYGYHWTGS